MNTPPVTIGLPVHNGANYLGDAIRCLREQTFGDFRMIVSDNASTDATEEIARSAASEDRRILYYRHAVNLGAPANYNYTLDAAESQFFMWHAHDDLRDSRFLELAHATLASSSEVSVTFSRAESIGPSGERLGAVPRPDGLVHAAPHQRLRAVVESKRPELVLFGLMRRQLLERTRKHGRFKGADRILVAEMGLLGGFQEIDEVLFYNREHPDRYTAMGVGPAAEQRRREWWDPDRTGGVRMPRWKGLWGYLGAIGRHPLPPSERVMCYVALIQSLFDNRMRFSKQLSGELMGLVPNALSWLSRDSRAHSTGRTIGSDESDRFEP